MLAEGHYAAARLRELAWNTRELLEDFTARTQERERTLHEAADFFRAAEKVCVCVCVGVGVGVGVGGCVWVGACGWVWVGVGVGTVPMLMGGDSRIIH